MPPGLKFTRCHSGIVFEVTYENVVIMVWLTSVWLSSWIVRRNRIT